MKKTIIIGLSMALGLALMATVALAWGPGFGPGFGRGFGMGPGYGSPPSPPILNLTAEQSSKIQALQKTFLDEIAPLQQDLLKKRTELQSLWLNQNPDSAAITAKQKEFWDLRSKLQEKGTNLRLGIRKVLTPEQQAQLPAFGPGLGFGPAMGFGPPIMSRMGRW